MFNPGEVVTNHGDVSDNIFFVSRGIFIEKSGELEDFNTP